VDDELEVMLPGGKTAFAIVDVSYV